MLLGGSFDENTQGKTSYGRVPPFLLARAPNGTKGHVVSIGRPAPIVDFGLFEFRLQPIGIPHLVCRWKSPFIRGSTGCFLKCCGPHGSKPA